MKYLRPKAYQRPSSARELLDRYAEGERYFEDARLRGECLDFCQLDNVNLSRANLSSSFMRKATFTRVDFTDSKCAHTTFEKSGFYQCSFARADLRNTWFYHTKVAFVSFFGARMERGQFLDCLQFARPQEKAGLLMFPAKTATCFVSYSSVDRFPSHVAQSLQRANIPHWFRPYSSWFDSEISEHLARAILLCDFFVLVLSKNALCSKWVKSEIRSALRVQSKKNSPRIIILKTGGINLPKTGRFAALSDCRLIDCSAKNRAGGLDEMVALLRESKEKTKARPRT